MRDMQLTFVRTCTIPGASRQGKLFLVIRWNELLLQKSCILCGPRLAHNDKRTWSDLQLPPINSHSFPASHLPFAPLRATFVADLFRPQPLRSPPSLQPLIFISFISIIISTTINSNGNICSKQRTHKKSSRIKRAAKFACVRILRLFCRHNSKRISRQILSYYQIVLGCSHSFDVEISADLKDDEM